MAIVFASLVLPVVASLAAAAPQTELYRIKGTSRARFDGTVAPAGDLDRDGVTDFLVGGVGGAVSGRTGRRLFGPVGLGPVENLAGNVGDVDDDGVDDLLFFGTGFYSGAALMPPPGVRGGLKPLGQLQPDPRIDEPTVGGGIPLADMNGDGVAEVLVGWPDVTVIRCGGDVVTIASGDTGGIGQLHSGGDGAILWEAEALARGDGLGGTVARIGDVDADGRDDVLVITRIPTPIYCTLGGARYLQARSAASGTLLWSIDFPFSSAPVTAAALDDVDGDDVPDLALGFPWSRPIEVRSGASGGLLWTIEHDGDAQDFFGYRLYSIADVDGDSLCDLVVAAPQPAVWTPSTGPGFVRIVSGGSGAPLLTLRGQTVGAQFGFSVAVLGDVNGDGSQELAIGSPWEGGAGLVQVISIERVGARTLQR